MGADGGQHDVHPRPRPAGTGQPLARPRSWAPGQRPPAAQIWPTAHGTLLVSFPDGSTVPSAGQVPRPAPGPAAPPASAGPADSATAAAPHGVPARQHRGRGGLGGGLSAAAHGVAFCALAAVELLAVTGLVLSADLLLRGGDILGRPDRSIRLLAAIALIPVCMIIIRRLARLTRTLAPQWCGVLIPSPYRQLPAAPDGVAASAPAWTWPRLRLVVSDPATWRDLLWAIVNPAGAFVLAAVPVVLVGGSLIAVILPALHVQVSPPLPFFTRSWHVQAGPQTWQPVVFGMAVILLGLWAAPPMLTAYGSLARSLLGPTRKAELALRVHHLAQTRSDTIDASAAELRRIERDLHDGAQARLVALGMTLDTAEQLMDTSPETSRALLAEARLASVRALAELRSLVRGIHPPVLADRGLADAIHALALDCPVRVQVTGELPGRAPLPVESGAYFAVSELLANVAKHASAREVWVDLRYSGGMLRISVRDDGAGGADPSRGTGLRGIERRLSSFDGVLALSSPAGGPTTASMEIPCALAVEQEHQ
jgi:signal transduction histidine kinase